MLTWSPLADHAYYESPDETQDRYVAIARSIAKVVLDPAEAPLFGGAGARVETGLLISSIAFHESGGFRRDVQMGMGKHARGDGGRSWCVMQINIGGGRTAEQWTGPDLVADPEKCIRAGLHRMREALARCTGQSFLDRLSGYTDGRCRGDAEAARRRTRRAVQFWDDHPWEGKALE